MRPFGFPGADGVVHLRLEQRLDQVALHRLGHAIQAVGLIEGHERDTGFVKGDLEAIVGVGP